MVFMLVEGAKVRLINIRCMHSHCGFEQVASAADLPTARIHTHCIMSVCSQRAVTVVSVDIHTCMHTLACASAHACTHTCLALAAAAAGVWHTHVIHAGRLLVSMHEYARIHSLCCTHASPLAAAGVWSASQAAGQGHPCTAQPDADAGTQTCARGVHVPHAGGWDLQVPIC
jgi:hypothetical protein